jgi:hypothetical protein
MTCNFRGAASLSGILACCASNARGQRWLTCPRASRARRPPRAKHPSSPTVPGPRRHCATSPATSRPTWPNPGASIDDSETDVLARIPLKSRRIEIHPPWSARSRLILLTMTGLLSLRTPGRMRRRPVKASAPLYQARRLSPRSRPGLSPSRRTDRSALRPCRSIRCLSPSAPGIAC